MKRLFCVAIFALCSLMVFAESFEDKVQGAISSLIPDNHQLIEVQTPVYDETFAASDFSDYLKETIECVLTDCGKDLFDMDMDSLWDEALANMSDIGYSMDVSLSGTERKAKSGTLSAKFSVKKKSVEILFAYYNGKNTRKKRITISVNDIPDMECEPDNLELAQEVYADIKNAEAVAKRDKDKSIPIVAAMLDSDKNMVDVLYPYSRVSFMIGSPEKDAYIAVLNISAEGKKFWLIKNKFIPAGETWESPKFRPADNVYGQELIYVYAASSPEGLPTTDSDTEYLPDTITAGARELVMDCGEDDIATGVFAITYTVLPDVGE
ncbi:MAG: hypothetical protein ILP07_04210 [Treponema sp.]|nr:hypothetical protein [Treponema sp.]